MPTPQVEIVLLLGTQATPVSKIFTGINKKPIPIALVNEYDVEAKILINI